MRLFLFTIFLFAFFSHSSAQNLSFSCPHDTILGCSINCLDINATFPDLQNMTDKYVVTNVSPSQKYCYPIINPGAPGTSTSLILDDVYSAVIPLPFSFIFYGQTYNSLIASTNGFISFDVSKTGLFSHYDNLGDLPNNSYDKAIIMGPYMDMDPTVGTSPTQQIKYNVVGTAPNRSWVLSFYKVPLYSNFGECGSLINNTSQIILHETTNIIEITIVDKEICSTWNNGKAMIGIQDDTRSKALMAPQRFESSPPWGTTGMNETWRFIPAAGVHLYKSVELLDNSGTTIATGDTIRINASTFGYTFNNVCAPPGNGSFFVVKTTYKDAVNPAATFYSLDSLFVIPNKIPVTASATNASCGVNDGTIIATATGGTSPYSFSLDGGAGQPTGNFTNVGAGTHTVIVTDIGGCQGKVTVVITTISSLQGTFSKSNASCPGVNNGSITVTPTNGVAPFSYSANGGPSQLSNTFAALPPGTYTIVFTDVNGCNGSITTTISPGSNISGSASSTPTSCNTSADGTITASGSGGVAPYSYSLDGGPFQFSGFFTGVLAGNHIITINDFRGCTINVSRNVAPGTTLNGTATTTATSCPNVSNGSITVNPSIPGNYTYILLPGNITQVNNPVFTALAAGTYSVSFSNSTGCSGSVNNIIVAPGQGLTSTTTITNPPCANINDGRVTINATSGVAPYAYTLSPNPVSQASSTFTNLAAGNYTYSFSDGNGCTGTGSFTLTTNTLIAVPSIKTLPLCNGNSNGSVTFTPSGGVAPYQYLLQPGTIYQSSSTFAGLAAGTYTFTIKDNVGCSKDTIISLSQPSLLTASATNPVAATCNGNDGTIQVSGAGGTVSYMYSIDNGVTYQASPTFIAPSIGSYPNIKVKDANGCIVNTSTTVQLLDTMRLSLGPDTVVCVGSSITLQPQTNDQTTVFNWTAIPSTAINTLNNPALKNPLATPLDTTTYVLNARWGVCTRQDDIVVNVLAKPIAHAGTDVTLCPGESTVLRGSATNVSGPVSYSWAPAFFLNRSDSNVVVAKLPDGSNTLFTLTVTDNYGCNFRVTDDVRVIIRPTVKAFAGNDTIAVKGIPHQLYGSGGSQYTWSPAAPLNNANIPNPLATLNNDTQFTLVVRDVIGCLGYDTVFVKVYTGPTYYTPNAFTPNNDGRNDIFRAIPVGIVTTEYFRIFDRYGTLVFETNKWLQGWDGTYKSRPQTGGAYVWIIKGTDRNGKTVEQKGTVVLIR